MNCKYTLRDYLKSLEDFHELISTCTSIDMYRKISMKSKLKNRIKELRSYLNLEDMVHKKQSFTDIFKSNFKYTKKGE